MENETIWRSRVQHDSEYDVAHRGGPTGFIGGGDIKERNLSEKLSREAEIARRTKIAAAVFALRRCSSQEGCASILATLNEVNLTPRERVPLIRTLRMQGFTQGETIKAMWRIEGGQGYEEAEIECQKVLDGVE